MSKSPQSAISYLIRFMFHLNFTGNIITILFFVALLSWLANSLFLIICLHQMSHRFMTGRHWEQKYTLWFLYCVCPQSSRCMVINHQQNLEGVPWLCTTCYVCLSLTQWRVDTTAGSGVCTLWIYLQRKCYGNWNFNCVAGRLVLSN